MGRISRWIPQRYGERWLAGVKIAAKHQNDSHRPSMELEASRRCEGGVTALMFEHWTSRPGVPRKPISGCRHQGRRMQSVLALTTSVCRPERAQQARDGLSLAAVQTAGAKVVLRRQGTIQECSTYRNSDRDDESSEAGGNESEGRVDRTSTDAGATGRWRSYSFLGLPSRLSAV